MRALKFRAVVDEDHTLSLELPVEVPRGPVELIVLVPEGTTSKEPVDSLREFFESLEPLPGPGLTLPEINRRIEQEREGW